MGHKHSAQEKKAYKHTSVNKCNTMVSSQFNITNDILVARKKRIQTLVKIL